MSDDVIVPAVSIEKDLQRFSRVPLPLIQAMRERKVSYPVVALYAALESYRNRKTGDCYPGLRTLADDLGIGVSTAHRLIHQLMDAGFVREEKPSNRATFTKYILTYAPAVRVPSVEHPTSIRFPASSAGKPTPAPHVVPGPNPTSIPYDYLNQSSGKPEVTAGSAPAVPPDRIRARQRSCPTCSTIYTQSWNEAAKRHIRRCLCTPEGA